MEHEIISPKFREAAFACPHCRTYALQRWTTLVGKDLYVGMGLYAAMCDRCHNASIWVEGWDSTECMVYPGVVSRGSLPDSAGQDVIQCYQEAASIAQKSPRAAMALLRLALEMLCKKLLELDGQEHNLRDMANKVSEKYHLSEEVAKSMDILRITGNNAIHAGKIALEDNASLEPMFWLLTYVCEQAISKHEKAKKILEATEKESDNATEPAPSDSA